MELDWRLHFFSSSLSDLISDHDGSLFSSARLNLRLRLVMRGCRWGRARWPGAGRGRNLVPRNEKCPSTYFWIPFSPKHEAYERFNR